MIIYTLVPPKVSLEIGNTLNAQNIKEEDDVYFECKILANPVHHKITWKHNVSNIIIIRKKNENILKQNDS